MQEFAGMQTVILPCVANLDPFTGRSSRTTEVLLTANKRGRSILHTLFTSICSFMSLRCPHRPLVQGLGLIVVVYLVPFWVFITFSRIMSSVRALAEEGDVVQIQVVVVCGAGRFLCFTSCVRESWIIHVTDGIDVWRLIMDQTSLDSHRELAEVEGYEVYFARFKKAFTLGDLVVTRQAHKVSLDVGTGSTTLKYDLYEATANERKADLKFALFWLADTVSDMTKKLSKCEEELSAAKKQKGATSVGTVLPDLDTKKRSGQVKVHKQQGHSIVNPSSKRRKAATGVEFD